MTATWDIETENWTTFVCGSIHTREGGRKETKVYDWKHEEDYLRHLLSIEGNLYSFNGGRFDMKWLLDAMRQYGIKTPRKVIAKPSAIISIQCGHSRFLDACLTFPMKLKEFTNGAKTNVASLCKCLANCGGYCAIRRDASDSDRMAFQAYNAQDAEVLWDGIAHFETVAQALDIDLRPTIGGSAWQTVKRVLSLPPSPYIQGKTKQFGLWERVRQAYYGGRSEIFRTESPRGFQYDVNSMYPAAIASIALPLGGVSVWHGIGAKRAFHAGKPGVYFATVDVPPMFAPPLPVRVRWRTTYPTGSFSGCWTRLELSYAESIGVRILAFGEAITFDDEQVLFRDWVDALFDARMTFGKKSREGKWLKLVMNSLTGKFGTKCESLTIHIDPKRIVACSCLDSEDCQCGGFSPFANTDWMFTSAKQVLYDCARPEWAAYLTSAARVELHKQITRGNDDAVYCDTDSVFAESPRSYNVGDGIGEWSNEGGYTGFEALAPKVYHYSQSGVEKVRCKGIPTRDWERLASGLPIPFESMAGPRSPVGGKFFVRIKSHRQVNRNTGARVMVSEGPGTRAITYNEALSMFGRRAT